MSLAALWNCDPIKGDRLCSTPAAESYQNASVGIGLPHVFVRLARLMSPRHPTTRPLSFTPHAVPSPDSAEPGISLAPGGGQRVGVRESDKPTDAPTTMPLWLMAHGSARWLGKAGRSVWTR